MIVSAISLWKKFNTTTPLAASEWEIEERGGVRYSSVAFSGHKSTDGSVRIYARFAKPIGAGKKPAILLLPDAGKPLDKELFGYFVDKGYAVLMPDYSGKMPTDTDSDFRTVYPPSLDYGNYVNARGLTDMENLSADQTTWFEWQYVSLFSLEYLKSREDIGNIGVVGIRKGGELAWQTMLSPDVKCGVPVNAVGWRSFSSLAKFGNSVAHNLSDDRHRYIAAVEAQSYAPYVKCPVLMLCALRDDVIDCDRAYDTYSRIGNTEGNALV
ncbi:MAG: dienelactone hydrolase family protein [Clostridia bacterium]|nr:dienelactone hydrolase family protein [Clostridia bacterium]